MDLNRLTGELVTQGRYTAEVLDLLIKVCDGKVPSGKCPPRIEKMKGGFSLVDCMGTANDLYCPRFKNVGLPMPLRSQCRKAEGRF
jgi:hypothetical protein